MYRRAKTFELFALSLFILLSLAACSKTDDTSAAAATDTAPAVTADTEQTYVDDVIYEDYEWEGVYKSETGMVVIRDVEDDFAVLIIDMNDEDSETGYLAAWAEVTGDSVICYEDSFFVTITLSDDVLTMTQEGDNPYAGSAAFSGEFKRTDEDPYSYEAIMSTPGSALPDTLSETILNGDIVTLYIDPQSRFSATAPCLFNSAPADGQPEDGVYLETLEKDANLCIEVTNQGGQTAQELADYLTEQYAGSTVEVTEDGMVRLEYSFTDGNGIGWTEVMYFRSETELLIKVDYVFVSDNSEYFKSFCDLITINIT